MAIAAGVCDSAKLDWLRATHAVTDTYKIALYGSGASLSSATTEYTVDGEITGTGYDAGGQVLANIATGLTAGVAWMDWDDPAWTGSTITARGAVIYNASKSNKALAVLDFGADISSTNGPFTIYFPSPGASAVVRIM